MGTEARISQAFKDSFISALQGFYAEPTYRCMFLDDEPSEVNEERDFPCIEVKVNPAIPRGYRSVFKDAFTEITFTTTVADDPKKIILCEMYDRCRQKIEWFDYGIMAIFIEDSDASDSDNRQEITLSLRCSMCSA